MCCTWHFQVGALTGQDVFFFFFFFLAFFPANYFLSPLFFCDHLPVLSRTGKKKKGKKKRFNLVAKVDCLVCSKRIALDRTAMRRHAGGDKHRASLKGLACRDFEKGSRFTCSKNSRTGLIEGYLLDPSRDQDALDELGRRRNEAEEASIRLMVRAAELTEVGRGLRVGLLFLPSSYSVLVFLTRPT